MPTPRPAILVRRLLAALPALALGVVVSCSSEADPLAVADAALKKGDLERAERLIDGLDGAAADELRETLQGRFERREKELGQIEEFLAGMPGAARITVQRQLEELRRRSKDKVVKREIDARLSKLNELYAEAARLAKADEPEEPAKFGTSVTVARATRAEPETAFAEPERAVREDDRWNPYANAPAQPVSPPALSQPGVEVVVTEVSRPERVVQVQPENPGPDKLASEVAEEHVDRARAFLRDGDLESARSEYLSAAAAATYGIEREEYVGLARDVDDRRQLRAELASSFASDRRPFEALGVTALDTHGVTSNGETVDWRGAEAELLERVCGLVSLSARAEIGWIHERLARRHVVDAWAHLEDLRAEGRVDAETVTDLVSRYRGERAPEGGYVFRGGDWIAKAELDARARDKRLAKLSERLENVRFGREEELDRIAREFLSDDGAATLGAALVARFENVAEELADDRTTKRLEKIADLREALDAARVEALALIFDEETYFYPYKPPECPPDKAKLYAPVQQRVDELRRAVEDAWEIDENVVLAKEYLALRTDVDWIRERCVELEVELDLTVLPSWYDGVPATIQRVSVREFAWDAEEAQALERDRAVLAYNARVFASESWPADVPEGVPDAGEQRQVAITNEYRRQMGRRALAWNPRIQAAAQDHSDYMSRTGDFGHFEPDPETRTPNDRMRRRDYNEGRSENCAMSGGADSAHAGWLRSSGHHRNILLPDHREMGSASAGTYWTQNFGGGRGFENDL